METVSFSSNAPTGPTKGIRGLFWSAKTKGVVDQSNFHDYIVPRKLRSDQFTIKSPELFESYLSLISSLHSFDLDLAKVKVSNFVFEILSRYCSPAPDGISAHSNTQFVRQNLLSNLSCPPSLSDLSQQLSVREETIIRRFKRDTGLTTKAFINNARVEKARLLIKEGMDLAEVALLLGFSDQSHFHKFFVSYTASTPRQYQNASC